MNGQQIKLVNTCPLDTWFTLLKIVFETQPSFIKFAGTNFGEMSSKLFQHIANNDFNEAKLQIAKDNDINPEKGAINFFSGEYSFIKRYLSPNLTNRIHSSCDSPYCPQPIVEQEQNDLPTINFGDYDDTEWISPEAFKEEIMQWVNSSADTRCGKRLEKPTVEQKFMFWNENKTDR